MNCRARVLTTTVALVAAILILVGCGGGGSGSVALTVHTDWTNAALPGGGQSVRMQLLSANGALTASTLVNASSATTTDTPFSGLAPGVYHLSLTLFSQADAGGVQVGSIDAFVDVVTSQSFNIAVGGTQTALVVSPANATCSVGQTQQFFADGISSAGTYTFIDPTTVTWSVLNGVGTIDSQGIFNATTAGNGSIRATQGTTGLTGAATVNVTQANITQSKWTIMVYMNAANDLSYYSPLNFEQMQQVATNPDVRIVVQWKQVPSLGYPTQFNGTRRYLVNYSTASTIASTMVQDLGTAVDMGSPATLSTFIDWAKTYYPAQHYCLVVWDHGNGWNRSPATAGTRAVSYDSEFGTAIQTWQLSQALGSTHFDILAWDASLMQMAEVTDEIASHATYIVGGEASPPGAGYPYNLVFGTFEQNPDAPVLDLAKGFVDGMIQGYAATSGNHITQSVVDPTKLPALTSAVKDLGTALIGAQSTTGFASAIQNVRATAQDYSQTGVRYYFDLYDLTSKLDASGIMPSSVTSADAEVRAAIGSAVLYNQHNSEAPNSYGVSIDFSPGSIFNSEVSDYAQLKFQTDTGWGDWLKVAP